MTLLESVTFAALFGGLLLAMALVLLAVDWVCMRYRRRQYWRELKGPYVSADPARVERETLMELARLRARVPAGEPPDAAPGTAAPARPGLHLVGGHETDRYTVH